MKIRGLIVVYALVLALWLFADRRHHPSDANRYTRVVDLSAAPASPAPHGDGAVALGTRIISPAALIPGTWTAGQIPPERLVAPLVVMDVKPSTQIVMDDIANWESRHGVVPQGSVVAIRCQGQTLPGQKLPITAEAAQFLLDARYVLAFVTETPADLTLDRTLTRQIALHGAYIVEGSTRLPSVPETGSMVLVAPAKSKTPEASVRVLAMVR